MEFNNECTRHQSPFKSDNAVSEELGLPAWIENALGKECIHVHAVNDWGLPEHEKVSEKQLFEKLTQELSDSQFSQVKELYSVMMRRLSYTKKFMFYSGVKQGIRFYKDFQSIFADSPLP